MLSRLLLATVLAATLSLPAARSAYAAAQAGEVLALFGDCVLASEGQHTPLKVGAPVHVGDTIDVLEGAKLKLRMADGSVIAAGSGSHLRIDSYDVAPDHRDAKLSLAAGLLRAIVSKAGSSSSFEVTTATGVAAVRSTDWFIEATPQSTQVGVLSGVVDLASRATGRDVRIPARWGARVEAGMDPVPARVWQEREFANDIALTDVK